MEKISVDRYMLIVTIERKIYQPLFFKDIKCVLRLRLR